MNKKIHSLALLVNLGIYGVAQAQEPTDTPVSHDDTIVVTAAEQNLQAPGVSTITADEIRKNGGEYLEEKSSARQQDGI